ncbi:hypothetical protein Q8A67_004810 [Cirrhinus molitorella]|uniref:C-type lectin domain-containing protein n=1 Tax=Cirrhinus molitorella TaxID=172907 RepID=A0AA88TWT5_9TELE|nr:hypothetical protein Q8A67_004810 [Cirrhinus molitorella]
MHRNDTNLNQFIWSDGDLQTNFYQWKDDKTWEEAVEHCRDHYTDLASLTTTQQLQQVKSNLKGETIIWVGLRFVAGQWYWLNAEPVSNEVSRSLPECPELRCGALNIMTEQWENRDCEEKLSFLCV